MIGMYEYFELHDRYSADVETFENRANEPRPPDAFLRAHPAARVRSPVRHRPLPPFHEMMARYTEFEIRSFEGGLGFERADVLGARGVVELTKFDWYRAQYDELANNPASCAYLSFYRTR